MQRFASRPVVGAVKAGGAEAYHPWRMDPSERVPLGTTALRVSRLSLGGAPIGSLSDPDPEAATHAIVRRAYELGIRAFDTAPLYGAGKSERRLVLQFPF